MVRLTVACVLVLLSCVGTHTIYGANGTRTRAIKQTIHVTAPQQGESHYYYLPFKVSSHIHRIDISYDYDKANGSNALDIGLFDSRSTTRTGDVRGFRGWSGGRRSEFFVSRDSATPGYVAGEMPAGIWHVILGLYRVAPGGVDVTFKIELETDELKTKMLADPTASKKVSSIPSITRALERRALAQEKSPRWIVGDLHMHTVHSDGDWNFSDLINAATEAGLDFISVTDHNTMSHHGEIDQFNRQQNDPLIIRGEEITTYGGHANAWGLMSAGLMDFRVEPGDQAAMSVVVSKTHQQGALISINHPFASCAGCSWSYDKAAEGFDAIEVWNGSWDHFDELALDMWDRLLQKGRHITAIASSDSHRPANPLGHSATHVSVEGSLSVKALLKAIKGGHVYLSKEGRRPIMTFEAECPENRNRFQIGDTVRLKNSQKLRFKLAASGVSQPTTLKLISEGEIVHSFRIEPNSPAIYFEVAPHNRTYFRVELRDLEGTMQALTNPIYVEIKNGP